MAKLFIQSIGLLVLSTCLALGYASPSKPENNIPLSWLPGASIAERYLAGKLGIGPCPEVEPDDRFNINGILGTWYVHYHHELAHSTMTCGTWVVSRDDGETEGAPCRFKMVRGGIEISTGQFVVVHDSTVFVNDTVNQKDMTLISPGSPPYNWYPLRADGEQLVTHACEQFPGWDLPISAYYQHNFVLTRDRNEISPERLEAIRKLFGGYGINLDNFIKMDQENCA